MTSEESSKVIEVLNALLHAMSAGIYSSCASLDRKEKAEKKAIELIEECKQKGAKEDKFIFYCERCVKHPALLPSRLCAECHDLAISEDTKNG